MLTRDQLLERVWGYTFAGDTRTVDVHVRQLRRKLEDASPIVTVWGVGYKVSPAPVRQGRAQNESRRRVEPLCSLASRPAAAALPGSGSVLAGLDHNGDRLVTLFQKFRPQDQATAELPRR